MGRFVVTGSSGAIGSAIVRKLEADCHAVVPLDIKEGYDLADRATWDLHLGRSRYDGLIHAAGVQVCEPYQCLTTNEVDTMFKVNVTSFIELMAVLQPCFCDNACAIAIGSVHADVTAKNMAVYASTKAALVGLVRGMALEADGKYRVVCLSPGAVDTGMCRDNITEGGTKPEKWEPFVERIPAGAITTPDEVAEMCASIIGMPKSMTGCNIVMDGGASCLLGTES
jgi:NAD(P)-dependent dehydrogenase (short-subunit alcohol dehydrogenase family)